MPADGEGRNGVWLAELGLDVWSVDVSEAGIVKARCLAPDRGFAPRPSLSSYIMSGGTTPRDDEDAVVSVFFHRPSSLRRRRHRWML